MDYRKFLTKNTAKTIVLPYTGGLGVHTLERRLRLDAPLERPGWWRFELAGRKLSAQQRLDDPDEQALAAFEACKRVRGHLVGPWLFTAGAQVERVHFLPGELEDPEINGGGEVIEPLTPVSARRWHGGKLLHEGVDFDDEPELAAREALYEGRPLAAKGVTPSLRGALAWAKMARWAANEGIHVSPREVLDLMHELVDHSRTPQELFMQVHERNMLLNPHGEAQRWRQHVPPPPRSAVFREPPTRDNAERRAALVLDAAGADYVHGHLTGGRRLEVHFDFGGQRFIAVVDWESLHVYDSGICLSGHDEALGLDCLPAVIQEAINGGLLYITRHY